MKNVEFSLQRIEFASWLLLLFLCLAGVLFASSYVTTSILVGGIIANSSFGWLKKDLTRLFSNSLEGIKARFFIRYYMRLSALVALLFVLVKTQTVHALGLLIGLSTVFLGVLVTLVFETKRIYFNNMKEAA
jgi:hypothetical protein